MNARYCGRNRQAVPSPIGEAVRDRPVYYLFIPSFISGGRGSLSQLGLSPSPPPRSVPGSAGSCLQGICLGKGGRTQVTSGKVCLPRDPSRIRGQAASSLRCTPLLPGGQGKSAPRDLTCPFPHRL